MAGYGKGLLDFIRETVTAYAVAEGREQEAFLLQAAELESASDAARAVGRMWVKFPPLDLGHTEEAWGPFPESECFVLEEPLGATPWPEDFLRSITRLAVFTNVGTGRRAGIEGPGLILTFEDDARIVVTMIHNTRAEVYRWLADQKELAGRVTHSRAVLLAKASIYEATESGIKKRSD